MQPDNAAEQARIREEARRSIAKDFQDVFSTPPGKRVLNHLLNVILFARSPLQRPMNAQGYPTEMSANDALYLSGRRDAAIAVENMLNAVFADDVKPVVKRKENA